MLGARTGPEGVTFRVWAPNADTVAVRVRGVDHPMTGDEFREAAVAEAAAGDDYWFVVDGTPWPDPCSRWQPEGMRGPSRVLDPSAFAWTSDAPAPPALDELVIYELHIGTFSEAGTFAGAIEHLPALAELGVTAIEVMPVADGPGMRGWGYDGVYPSAAHRAYGGPEGFAQFVDAAHAAGLAVILDVVYNHIGASGNAAYRAFGPYFTDRHSTFWGEAIDYAQRGVREWALQSAAGWIEDFRVDGLRLDATHAIFDDSPKHIVAELVERVPAHALVIAESGHEDPAVVRRWGCDAMWGDDFHHALHALLTGERDGCYAEFGSVARLAEEFRRDEPFVVCAQNHDQVGNRAFGDRPAPEFREIEAACVLFSPFVPLLFMGEEYGENAPFLFFSDHIDEEIAVATREGRREEFAAFAAFAGQVPDPQDPATFERSKLTRIEQPGLRDHYRRLLALRRTLGPLEAVEHGDDWLVVRRAGATLRCDFAALTAEIVT